MKTPNQEMQRTATIGDHPFATRKLDMKNLLSRTLPLSSSSLSAISSDEALIQLSDDWRPESG